MKKSWMKRAISLMAALALALTTAGLAEMSSAPDPYDELIVAEAVDAVVEAGEMELCGDPETDETTPEASGDVLTPASATVTPPASDASIGPEAVNGNDATPAEPEADGDQAAPEATEDPEAQSASQETAAGEEPSDPKAAGTPEDQAAAKTPEASKDAAAAKPAEDKGSEAAPVAVEKKAEEPAPEAAEDKSEEAVPVATEKKAEEPAPEAAEDKAEESAPETAESKAEEPASEAAKNKSEETKTGETDNKTEEPAPEASEGKAEETTPEAAENKAEDTPEDAAQEPAEAHVADAAADSVAKAEEAVAETGAPAEAPAAEAQSSEAAALEAAPSALTFSAPKIYMGNGESAPLTVLSADTGAPVEVTLTSSKPAIVRVEGAGVLHARKKGIVKITATAANGVKATCIVKVVKAPSKIRLTPKKLIVGLGETRAMKAKLSKGSASAITWASDNPAVVTVDAAGNLQCVGVGTARVTASTFNKKKASCKVTVLNGTTPTSLTFPAATISMGKKEKLQLQPVLGAGEAALFTFSSSKKGVVSVNKNGLLTAKKLGTAKITVKTHNGLKFRLTVKVVKAPGKVTLSKSKLSLQAGQSAALKATLPAKTASAIAWSSSNANIASVDAAGNVAALSPGKATITAATFNGKKATCTVTVTAPPTSDELAKRTPPALSNAQMAANIRAATSLGSKRNALGNVAELLMNNGFECSFAAGVCANVYSEGSYGFFESSKYIKNYQKRPRYFCFLDGGDYYTKDANGNYVITDVYLSPEDYAAYTGPATKHLRFGDEKFYWNNLSGKYVWDVDLNFLQAFMDLLTDAKLLNGQSDGWNDGKGWHGKFGLGCTQWTGGRTRKLVALYRKYAGEGNATITKDQVIAAEHDMILYDLQGDYKKVYTGWRNENINGLYCPEAANSAGSWVCLKYEIPANKEESAVKRGKKAAEIYNIMVGAA
ncbi:MAG: Ig-like domain-containing protein [Clostridia bacterium]|nr:Ig-like domain-containing protein [Clostridia bacterium]